jgi:hypothetical protein
MSGLSIKRLLSGGVITTYHCVSRCGHCLYNCGPHRSKDYLDARLAERIFARIAGLGCRSVHIGGGEPLLDPKALSVVLDAARRSGMGIDYVETNSAWFVDPQQAEAVLTLLRASGLGTLLVSISPFHNARIPFARVRGVIEACRRCGVQVFPWVADFTGDLERLDPGKPHSMAEFTEMFGNDYLERIPDRYWIHLGGRALETFRRVYRLYPAESILKSSPLRCVQTLSDTSHFHIDLFGNYIPGLCAGLSLAMEDLGGPLSAAVYPLLHRLASAGVRGLYDYAAGAFGYTPQQSGYLNHCDLCTEIRGFLFHRQPGKFSELAPAGFYDEHGVEPIG